MKEFTATDLAAYLEGRLPADELRSLEEALRQDPRLRKELLVLAGFESEMPGALREAAQAEAVPRPAVGRRLPRRQSRSLPKVLPWVVALAAGIAIALWIALPGRRPEKPAQESGLAAQAPETVPVVQAPLPAPVEKVAASSPATPPAGGAGEPREALVSAVPTGTGAGSENALVARPLAMVAVSAAMAVAEAPEVGRLTDVQGEVQLIRLGREAAERVTQADTRVRKGDALALGADGSAKILCVDGSELQVCRQSRIAFDQSPTGLEVELAYGALDLKVTPQSLGVCVAAPASSIRPAAAGTQFRLMADAKGAWVGVREGEVEVTRVVDGQKVTLKPGNYAAVTQGWPFARMDARVCPVWKSVCQQAAGNPYP